MSAEELKPCPFCGQPDRAQHLPTCWFLLRDIGASRARLAEAWNRRAAPAAGTVEKDVERYHVMRAQLSGRDLDYYRLEGEPESEIDAYCDAAIEAHAKAGKD